MKKALVIMMAVSMLFAMGGMALAKQDGSTPGNIVANEYTPRGYAGGVAGVVTTDSAKSYRYFEEGRTVGSTVYAGANGELNNPGSTHVYGTWNSPYTAGVDGYNYNDAQDYVAGGNQVSKLGSVVTSQTASSELMFQSGPHGGYLTSTHRCRECHAVHRAAGKFKLLRSDTRFEACDWCHGTGAGSGYNIQMDNDDNFTTEYNVGHTMGFGISAGKWRAPDDTYPAYTPNYWQGGFSCFDCHSPHANPQRMLGFNDAGVATGIKGVLNGKVYGIVNSGGDDWSNRLNSSNNPQMTNKPFWLSGSWLLIKNPDREIASRDTTVSSGLLNPNGVTMANVPFNADGTVNLQSEGQVVIKNGQEIPDVVTASLREFDGNTSYPVNKVPIDWNSPIGNGRTLWRLGDGNGVTESFNSSNGKVADFLGLNVRRQDVLNAGWPLSEYYNSAAMVAPFRNDTPCNVWSISDFCTDCHDGNAGLHTVKAPLFSEDRALRGTTTSGGDGVTTNDRAHYDLAYGHDAQPRH